MSKRIFACGYAGFVAQSELQDYGLSMVRDYIVNSACVLLFVGFAAGIIGQLELLKPGILFLSPAAWPPFLTIHVWATPIALGVICLSTISLVRHRTALALWAVWAGFAVVPLLIGIVLTVMLKNVGSADSYLYDTVYNTAARHAFSIAVLLIALGGLSILKHVKSKTLPLQMSFVFAFLIAASGVALMILQASLGLNGVPRRYIDYPQEFAQLQFYSSVAAITCSCVSMLYLTLLWRFSREDGQEKEDVF